MGATLDLPDMRLRTAPSRGLAEPPKGRIDRKQNVIYGFAVVTKGVTRDARGEFDDAGLNRIVELARAAPRCIKSRFTHPGLSGDGLGKFLGRSLNFCRDGDVVRADLHLSPRAFDTPDGDLGTYVMNLAESDPDMFGASMAIAWDKKFRVNPDGTRQTDRAGNPLPPLIWATRLHATDIVDDPAANSGFFSDDTAPDWAARQATAVLDRLFADADEETVRAKAREFIDQYLAMRGHGSTPSSPASEPPPSSSADQPTATPSVASISSPPYVPAAARPKQPEEMPLHGLNTAQIGKDLAILAYRNEFANNRRLEKHGLSLQDYIDSRLIDDGYAILEPRALRDARGGKQHQTPRETHSMESNDTLSRVPQHALAQYRAEYAEHRAAFAKHGLSEEDYCFSRGVDDQYIPLVPRSMEQTHSGSGERQYFESVNG